MDMVFPDTKRGETPNLHTFHLEKILKTASGIPLLPWLSAQNKLSYYFTVG